MAAISEATSYSNNLRSTQAPAAENWGKRKAAAGWDHSSVATAGWDHNSTTEAARAE